MDLKISIPVNQHDAEEVRMVFLITVFSFVTKILFLLNMSDYGNHLMSDMLGYWLRANQRLLGDPFDVQQWSVWPTLPHIVITEIFRFTQWADIFPFRLEFLLVFFCLISSLSLLFVYGLAKEMMASKDGVLGAVFLTAFSYPLIYLNTFVLSENFAGPLLTAAMYFLVKNKENVWRILGAGFLFGVCAAMRPNYWPFLILFLGYLIFQEKRNLLRIRFAGFFLLGILMVVMAIGAENSRISKGQLKGLAPNGGMNFFVQQCKPYRIELRGLDGNYAFIHPSFNLEPERGTVVIDRSARDQEYFFRRGWECIQKNPWIWLDNFKRLTRVVKNPTFPYFPEVPGNSLMIIWKYLSAGMVLLVSLFLMVFSMQKKISALWLVVSLIPLVLCAEVLFFPLEYRYFIPCLFAVYLSVFAGLERIFLKQDYAGAT